MTSSRHHDQRGQIRLEAREPGSRIVPERARAQCLGDLSRRGFEDSAIHVLEGIEGCLILDVSGRGHGMRGRIVRLYQAGGAAA